MKKLLLLLSLVFSIFLLTACLGSAETEVSLHYYLDDGSAVPADVYSESNLTIKPDYELRTLAITYSKAFPKKVGDSVDQPINTDGVVAAAFFDSFEEVLGILSKNPKFETDGKKEGDANFVVKMNGAKGETKYDISVSSSDDVETVKKLYFDIVKLFSEDVY